MVSNGLLLLQVYLSEASKDAEIMTAKSSEMNIMLLGGEGEPTEHPVPEQFLSRLQGGKLVTTPVSHAG